MIHTCVIHEENIPFELCKTPLECPHVDVLSPEQKAQFWDLLPKYWKVKVDSANIELKKHSDVEPTQWITLNALIQNDTPMWKGYLSVTTAAEYFNYYTQ